MMGRTPGLAEIMRMAGLHAQSGGTVANQTFIGTAKSMTRRAGALC